MIKNILRISIVFIFMLSFISISHAEINETTIMNDIEPYTGYFGPNNYLYPVKLMFEYTRELLTFNELKRAELQMKHAELRISEFKGELIANRSQNALNTMVLYQLKINDVDNTISKVKNTEMSQIQLQQLNQIQSKFSNQNMVLNQASEKYGEIGSYNIKSKFMNK